MTALPSLDGLEAAYLRLTDLYVAAAEAAYACDDEPRGDQLLEDLELADAGYFALAFGLLETRVDAIVLRRVPRAAEAGRGARPGVRGLPFERRVEIATRGDDALREGLVDWYLTRNGIDHGESYDGVEVRPVIAAARLLEARLAELEAAAAAGDGDVDPPPRR